MVRGVSLVKKLISLYIKSEVLENWTLKNKYFRLVLHRWIGRKATWISIDKCEKIIYVGNLRQGLEPVHASMDEAITGPALQNGGQTHDHIRIHTSRSTGDSLYSGKFNKQQVFVQTRNLEVSRRKNIEHVHEAYEQYICETYAEGLYTLK